MIGFSQTDNVQEERNEWISSVCRFIFYLNENAVETLQAHIYVLIWSHLAHIIRRATTYGIMWNIIEIFIVPSNMLSINTKRIIWE